MTKIKKLNNPPRDKASDPWQKLATKNGGGKSENLSKSAERLANMYNSFSLNGVPQYTDDQKMWTNIMELFGNRQSAVSTSGEINKTISSRIPPSNTDHPTTAGRTGYWYTNERPISTTNPNRDFIPITTTPYTRDNDNTIISYPYDPSNTEPPYGWTFPTQLAIPIPPGQQIKPPATTPTPTHTKEELSGKLIAYATIKINGVDQTGILFVRKCGAWKLIECSTMQKVASGSKNSQLPDVTIHYVIYSQFESKPHKKSRFEDIEAQPDTDEHGKEE